MTPHKTWIRELFPHHAHDSIHPCSWKPIKRSGWLVWLFGAKSVKGFSHPSTYWRNRASPTACCYCSGFHNASVHGHIGMCSNLENPLVHAWLQAWGPQRSLVTSWRNTATPRDRFLLGKLVLPVSLVEHLRAVLGPRSSTSTIKYFHAYILPLLSPSLPV